MGFGAPVTKHPAVRITSNSQTIAAGLWSPSLLNAGDWNIQLFMTFSTASGNYDPYNYVLLPDTDQGGIVIQNKAWQLFDQAGTQAFFRNFTCSAGQRMNINMNMAAKIVTISGVTTGNGSFPWTLGNGHYFDYGSGLWVGDPTGLGVPLMAQPGSIYV